MISCILLSAGLSSRFGSPKAIAELDGQTVIEHLQNQLINTQLVEIIIVLGARADNIKPYVLKHKCVRFVYNKYYNFGQTSSFKEGLKTLDPASKGIMLMPIDFPLVKRETLDILIDAFRDRQPLITVPTFEEKKGHPPIFHSSLKEEFSALDNSLGLNTIIHRHQEDTFQLPVDDAGVLKSFNTKEEFEQIKKAL